MENLQSYVLGRSYFGDESKGKVIKCALTGKPLYCLDTTHMDMQAVLEYGRQHGQLGIAKMTFIERAQMLKKLAKYLLEHKKTLYKISTHTGATKTDSWIDIEGGIATLFNYASLANRELPDDTVWPEDDMMPLSKEGGFNARHFLMTKPGVALHINAYNFPCWGMLEKLAPTWIGGMPAIVKPASESAYLTHAMVRLILKSGFLPEGALQLICGSVGDMFDHLDYQDVVTFTGSARTGQMLKSHPQITGKSIPFNMEADSINCAILGTDVTPDMPEFELFIQAVVTEMTVKAGQKCTAIRRAIVPKTQLEIVSKAIQSKLEKVVMGDPSEPSVSMGCLISEAQKEDVVAQVSRLTQVCDVAYGGNEHDFEVVGASKESFYPPTLLLCHDPLSTPEVHSIEAFGPVCTLMPYDDLDQSADIAAKGKGSLVASLITDNEQVAFQLIRRIGAYHGRLHILNHESAKESTGHGSPLPMLVHGGPGRAGGGEEMGGLRGVKHYMQRIAVQGAAKFISAIGQEWVKGSPKLFDVIHPFKKYFEDLAIGTSFTTPRRTITEADIVNFACLSGDHFYAHMDEIAATESMFGRRVAHGYFIISAAAGLFVDAAQGPVIANYGMDNLRFIESVGIGDTIQVHLTCKRKVRKPKRIDESSRGIVVWDVEVINQYAEIVAIYSILTLVACRDELE